jgi:DNA primase large subunit
MGGGRGVEDLAARYPYSHWGSKLIAELGVEDLDGYTLDEGMLKRVLERFSSDNPDPERVEFSVDYLNPSNEVVAYLVGIGFLVYSRLPEYAKMRLGSRLFNWLSVRTGELLKTEEPRIVSELLSVDFSLPNVIWEDGKIVVGLTDFLRMSHMWESRLRLVELPIHRGKLILDGKSAPLVASQLCFSRLNQILEEKLRLSGPGGPRTRPSWVDALEAEVSKLVPRSWEELGGEGVLPRVAEEYPPCMKEIMAQMAKGIEPPHFARFAFAAFMRMIGAPKEETLKAFSTTSDYKENIASYHIAHIYGEIGSHTAYTAPSCDTLKTARLCPVEGYCNPKAKHPVTVYKINLRKDINSNRRGATQSRETLNTDTKP